MSDEVKTVKIQGGAVDDFMGGKKRTRRTAKKTAQEGGSEESVRGVSPVSMQVKGVESSSSSATNAGSPNPATWLKYPQVALVPPVIQPIPSRIPSTPNAAAAPTPQYAVPTQQQGGTKQVKVELKKKSHTKKVQLQPKKAEHHKASPLKKHHTRKIRKVTLGVSSLHKRITRAKKLHKSIKGMPMDKLKEKLVKGGLIKPTSKAPLQVLQKIASDAEIIAKKAL
jgi:hypothetical protein